MMCKVGIPMPVPYLQVAIVTPDLPRNWGHLIAMSQLLPKNYRGPCCNEHQCKEDNKDLSSCQLMSSNGFTILGRRSLQWAKGLFLAHRSRGVSVVRMLPEN